MDANLIRLIADKQENKEEIALVTFISSTINECRPGAIIIIDQNGQAVGDGNGIGDDSLQERIRKEAQKCISKGLSRRIELATGNGSIEVFIHALCHKERLLIIGSGNLVLNIYQIAQIIGYNITIVDDRTETLTRERFPEAELLPGNIIELLKTCEIDENTSIVIASHHHEWDESALQAIIGSKARYIGVLGNKRKVTSYFNNLNLMEVPDELLSRVYMPVGLDLGGQNTAEIALAVMAEIQAVKYNRPGGFLTIKEATRRMEKREELF